MDVSAGGVSDFLRDFAYIDSDLRGFSLIGQFRSEDSACARVFGRGLYAEGILIGQCSRWTPIEFSLILNIGPDVKLIGNI